MRLLERLTARIARCNFILWWSILWGIAVVALFPIVNYLTPLLNPSYNNQWTPDIYWRLVMYWHGGIFIPWITALAVVVCMTFKLNEMKGLSGRLVRDSVFYGGFLAVPIGGIAGLFDVFDRFAWGIPLWAQIFAFLIGDEMAIALIIALVMKPRVSGIGYGSIGLPYYTVLLGVSSALVAAVMGHVGGWISWFGPYPSVVPQYINSTLYSSLGYYNDTAVVTFTQNSVGSHSHLMVVALMAGIVALAASFYGYNAWPRGKKSVAGFGFIVMNLALAASVVIYVVSGVGNFSPPSLLTSGPGGVNGIAGDDLITGAIGLGALFVLFSLVAGSKSPGQNGKPLFRDPMFLSVISAWVIIYLLIPVSGYYIGLNHSYYQFAGASYDAAYTRFHQDFAFFFLPALVTVAIGLGRSGIAGRSKQLVGSLFVVGEIIAFVFGETYALFTLDMFTLSIAALGGVLMGIGGLIAVRYLLTAREQSITTILPEMTAEQAPTALAS